MLAVVATAVISVGAYFFIVKPGLDLVPSFMKDRGFLLAVVVTLGLAIFIGFNVLKGNEKKPVIHAKKEEAPKKTLAEEAEKSFVSA